MNPTLGQLIVRIGADTRQLRAAFNDVKGAVAGLQSSLESAGQFLTRSVTLPLVGLGTAAVLAGGNLQQARLGLESVTGSAAEAERQLERLRVLARNPGLGFRQAIDASVKLQTLGFSAEEAEAAIRELGNAVALTGGTREDFGEIARQFSQIRSLGRLTAENLNVIIERSPAVAAAMQAAFGTASAEAIRESGLSIDEFFARLQAGLETLPRAQASILDTFGNLKDDITTALAPLGQAIAAAITPALTDLVALITKVSDAFAALTPGQQRFIVFVGAAVAAIGPLLVALSGFLAILPHLTTALYAFALGLGPLGPLALAAAAAFVVAWRESEDFRTSMGNAWRGAQDLGEALVDLARDLGIYQDAAREAETGTRSLWTVLKERFIAAREQDARLLDRAINGLTDRIDTLRAALEVLMSGEFFTPGAFEGALARIRALRNEANAAANALAKLLGNKGDGGPKADDNPFTPLVTGATDAARATDAAAAALRRLQGIIGNVARLPARFVGMDVLLGVDEAGMFDEEALRTRLRAIEGHIRGTGEVLVEARRQVNEFALAFEEAFLRGARDGLAGMVVGLADAFGNLAANLAEFRNFGDTLRSFAEAIRRTMGDVVASIARAIAQAVILRAVLFGLNFLGFGGLARSVGGLFGLAAGNIPGAGAIAAPQTFQIEFVGVTPAPGGVFMQMRGGWAGSLRQELQIEKGSGLSGRL